MEPRDLTVARIVLELERPEVAPGFVAACQADPRASVRHAVEKRLRRALRDEREQARLGSLYELEVRLARDRAVLVGGVDEAGRGPLAGPVVAACVILPSDRFISGIDDSKKLTPQEREQLEAEIRSVALGVGVGIASADQIDRDNILNATRAAMAQAVRACEPRSPGHLLIDAVRIPGITVPQDALVRADARHACVAAASIVAKVTRDRMMVELDREHPGYGFADHKGYGTPLHLQRLAELGPCPVHRRSFAPVRDADPLRQVEIFRSAMAETTSADTLRRAGQAFAAWAPRVRPELVARLRAEYRRRLESLSRRSRRGPAAPEGRARSRTATGRWAEALATRHLVALGYRMVASNVRTRTSEIDLVCREGGHLVFVEVRSTSIARFGTALESITPRKKRKLALAARRFAARLGATDVPARFDVVGIDRRQGRVEVRVVRDVLSS